MPPKKVMVPHQERRLVWQVTGHPWHQKSKLPDGWEPFAIDAGDGEIILRRQVEQILINGVWQDA